MDIENSVALVTGANRGLGKAFVHALLAAGAKKVYAAARDPKTVEAQEGVVPVKLDVTNLKEIEAASKDYDDVTLIINNAGIMRSAGLQDPSILDNARAEWEVMYLGPLAMSQAFAPILANNGGGAIINVLSVLSWISMPNVTTYCAAKSAAWSLTNGIRQELRAQGTEVVGLHVGYMDTDMVSGVDAQKANPYDVAKMTLDGLVNGEEEILADGTSVYLKNELSNGVYLQPPTA